MQTSKQFEEGSYGADSLGVGVLSFCDAAAAVSSLTMLPACGTEAAAESGSTASVSGMSQVASID